MLTRLTILAMLILLPRAHAEPNAEATVRGYFEALGRNDFNRALQLTTGSAQARTAEMVGNLRQQAAAANARVELKLKHIDVKAAPDGSVEASFKIDVVGRKWIFKKVARRLNGRAQFHVGESAIVAIDGRIDG